MCVARRNVIIDYHEYRENDCDMCYYFLQNIYGEAFDNVVHSHSRLIKYIDAVYLICENGICLSDINMCDW